MAFAVAVVQGQKKLRDCPHIDPALINKEEGEVAPRRSFEDEQRQQLASLKAEVAALDFSSMADKVGGRVVDDQLAVNCLGKDFFITRQGDLRSECHNNLWVHAPLLGYIVKSGGREPGGTWVAFDDLAGAGAWSRFFAHRCRDDLHRLFDAHTDLLPEILDLFGARPLSVKDADISLMLSPLPQIPLVLNYWLPEPDFPSQLNLLFDANASDNLDCGLIYTLSRGLVEMFRQLIVKHSREGRIF